MSSEGRVDVETFVSPGFGQNAYLVSREDRDDAVAIDPGGAVGRLVATLRESDRKLSAILLTHAHFDHIEGIGELVESFPAPIYLHPADLEWYERAPEQAIRFGVSVDIPPPVDHPLEGGKALELAGLEFEVRAVPGHAPGHVLLYLRDAGIAFCGDVVFQGSIGRSDLPGGDFQRLMCSIREEVLTLPDDTVLYPGHGPSTTVGHERVSNPFLVPDLSSGLA